MLNNKKSQTFAVLLTIVAISLMVYIYIANVNNINKIFDKEKLGAKAFNLQSSVLETLSTNAYLISNAKQLVTNSMIDMAEDGGIYNKSSKIYRNATMLFIPSSNHDDFKNQNNVDKFPNFKREFNMFCGLNYSFLKRYKKNILDYSLYNYQVIHYPNNYIKPFTYFIEPDRNNGIFYFNSNSLQQQSVFEKESNFKNNVIIIASNPGKKIIPRNIAYCPDNFNKNGICELNDNAFMYLNRTIIHLESINIYVLINKTDGNNCIWLYIKDPNAEYYNPKNNQIMLDKNQDIKSILENNGYNKISKNEYCFSS